jgi:hypothetical protein
MLPNTATIRRHILNAQYVQLSKHPKIIKIPQFLSFSSHYTTNKYNDYMVLSA